MDESGFVLVMDAAAGVGIFVYAATMAAFFYPFMTGRRERGGRRAKKVLIVFLIYTAMYFANMAVPFHGWPCMVIVLALLTAVSGFLDVDRNFMFFLGVIFFCIRNLSVLVTRSISYFLGKHLEQRAKAVGNAENIFRRAALDHVFTSILQMILFAIMLYAVGRLLGKKAVKLHTKELCYLLLTPVTGILFVNIIFDTLLIVNGNQVFQLYEQFPVFVGVVPMVAALFYLGIVITVVSYQKMTGLQEEREKYFVEQQQVHAMQERMGEVEQFYDGIRRMKHEMRNHLTNIKGLVRSGSYGEVEQYIDKMDEGMDGFELTVRTGNAVTDVIVNDRQKAADKQGIRFRSEFSYPRSDGYDAYDIGIIINNLLQNAIEACGNMAGGETYISLSGRQKKKFYLINVKNSFEGEVAYDTGTGLPVSTKGMGHSLHGIGLSNVRREVDKYMGDMDIKVKKNEFSVTVLLQERRRKK